MGTICVPSSCPMGCQSGVEDGEPPVEPETYHTNRVGVGEMLQEHGWTKLSDDKAPAAFAMWDTFNGTAQRYAKVLDLPRPSVNCMSNKKAWSRGMIDAAHADKLPPCFLDVEQAVEARDDPTKREAWHEGGIYLKLATGVEGKGCQRCDNLEDLCSKWTSIGDSSKYLAQREIMPPAFGISPQLPLGYKHVIRVYVLNGEGPKWYMHEAMYTKFAPRDTPVIMPGHTSFYGRMIEDFPEGFLKMFPQMCENIFGLGESFKKVGDATKNKANDLIESHYHIHGLDVVVDEYFRPYTIEVNVYPSLKIDDLDKFPLISQHRRDRHECRSMLKDFFDFIVFPQLKHGHAGKPLGWIECWPKCPSAEECTKFLTDRGRVSDVAEFERVHAVPAANGSTLSWDAVAVEDRMKNQHDLH